MSPYLAAHTKKPSRGFGGCVSSRDVARTAAETPVAAPPPNDPVEIAGGLSPYGTMAPVCVIIRPVLERR